MINRNFGANDKKECSLNVSHMVAHKNSFLNYILLEGIDVEDGKIFHP